MTSVAIHHQECVWCKASMMNCCILHTNDIIVIFWKGAGAAAARIDAEHLHGRRPHSASRLCRYGLADSCGVPFVQGGILTRVAVKRLCQRLIVIELGGEDAKICF